MKTAELTTTDDYQEIQCFDTVAVTLQVSNASILVGWGKGVPPFYDYDEAFLPTVGQVSRRCDFARVKSLAAGRPAVVYLTFLSEGD